METLIADIAHGDMQNEIKTKSPKAIVRGNGISWLAIPLPRLPRELWQAFYEWSVNQAGEGELVSEESDGHRKFHLIVLDGVAGFTGDWLVRYGLTAEGEVEVLQISMLAEIIQ